jgi:hypothetical protein
MQWLAFVNTVTNLCCDSLVKLSQLSSIEGRCCAMELGEREADPSPRSSTWTYTSTSPDIFRAVCLIKRRDNLTFTFKLMW